MQVWTELPSRQRLEGKVEKGCIAGVLAGKERLSTVEAGPPPWAQCSRHPPPRGEMCQEITPQWIVLLRGYEAGATVDSIL